MPYRTSIAFGLLLSALSLLGGEGVAIVKNVTGHVRVKHDGVYSDLKTGTILRDGDLIQTDNDGNTGMIFNDGTLVAVGPKSMFGISRYRFRPASADYVMDVELHKGSALFESGKIGKLAPQNVIFRVPQGTVGIRGTKFIADVRGTL